MKKYINEVNATIEREFVRLHITQKHRLVSDLLDAGKNVAACRRALAEHSALERTLEVLDGSGFALLEKQDDARDAFRIVKAEREHLLAREREAEEAFTRVLNQLRAQNDEVHPIAEDA